MKKKRDNLQGFGEHTNYLKQKNKVLIYEYYITDKDFVQVPKLKNFEIERSLLLCKN